MLYSGTMEARQVFAFMTVFHDAVKLEERDAGKRFLVGWFKDEVSAIGAIAERVLMQSAIMPSRRQLPELIICTEYKDEWCKRKWIDFRRATRIKHSPEGRRVVRVPGTFGKVWI